MSATEHEQPEAKSSIKVTLNAKHEPQFEAKVVEGASDDDLANLRRQAVTQFRELKRELLA